MKPLPTPLNMYAHNVTKQEVKATGRKGKQNDGNAIVQTLRENPQKFCF
jgi:hypothetical protein